MATHTVANFLGRITVSGQWCRRPAPVGVLVFVVLIRLLFIPCILGYTHGHLHWLLPEDPRNLILGVELNVIFFLTVFGCVLLLWKR